MPVSEKYMCKDMDLEVTIEKTKYMEMHCDWNVADNSRITIANIYFEKVGTFKYLASVFIIVIIIIVCHFPLF